MLRQQAQQMPAHDPDNPDFWRLWYVRYADDWLLGYSSPREEAEQIKVQLAGFLRDELKLEHSQEKTLINCPICSQSTSTAICRCNAPSTVS